eukprot:scaffold47634_cov32-Cyclotella_meneghiniana.AAC.3
MDEEMKMKRANGSADDVRPTAQAATDKGLNNQVNVKRQKIDYSTESTNFTAKIQAGVHLKEEADVTTHNNNMEGDSSPAKSPKKKKKKKRKQNNNNNSISIDTSTSSAKQNAQSASIDEHTTKNQHANPNNQSSKQQSKPKPKPMMSTLQKSFLARLTSSRFRELNEQLYTKPSSHSYAQFTANPDLFTQYHTGFRRQVEDWPVNPVDVIYKKILSGYTKSIKEKKKNNDDGKIVVADFGCGDAKLAERLNAQKTDASSGKQCPFTVHSFDLVSGGNPLVTPADMTNVPLSDESVDVGVYCLALMGTNVADFVREGWRVLKFGGVLRVAEVRSRFEASNNVKGGGDGKKRYGGNKHKSDNGEGDDDDDGTSSSNPLMILDDFKSLMDRCGFRCTHVDQSNKMFLFMDFVKVKGSSGLSEKESFSAKPCIYKRR